jgi:hypothetical protein
MEITKKQIIALDKGETTVRELFPDVFKTKLEVGKWYRFKNAICFYKDNISQFGVDGIGDWNNECFWLSNENFHKKWNLATEEEVTEALKNEAVNRYKIGDRIELEGFYHGAKDKIVENLSFIYDENTLVIQNKEKYYIGLFHNGNWAEVIPTITKEEAEKILGKTIV